MTGRQLVDSLLCVAYSNAIKFQMALIAKQEPKQLGYCHQTEVLVKKSAFQCYKEVFLEGRN